MVVFVDTHKCEPLVDEPFSHWEASLFIRHTLHGVTIRDHSLVDQLIDSNMDSFVHAITLCDLVRHAPYHMAEIRLQTLLRPPDASPFILERIMKTTLDDLDPDILTSVKNHPSFQEISNVGMTWATIHDLHRVIAMVCFHTMNTLLQFNLCSIPTSYLPNSSKKVQRLIRRAKRKARISSSLIYACSHWIYYSLIVSLDQEAMDLMIMFLDIHALHWLEIMSVTRQDMFAVIRQLSMLKVSH